MGCSARQSSSRACEWLAGLRPSSGSVTATQGRLTSPITRNLRRDV